MRTEYELLPGSKQWDPGGERAFRFRTGYTAALQAQTAAQTPLLSWAGWLWLLYFFPSPWGPNFGESIRLYFPVA